MVSLRKASTSRERAAALIIVLAFVVLLTGLVVAYLSRATSDRQVAHSSFNQSKADLLAQSAMDNIIGDLRQEMLNGSGNPSPTASPASLYVPTSNANMVPQRFGTSDSMPNLIRRSVSTDGAIPLPALSSKASAVNSAPVDPANPKRGDITWARWNKHYLVPRPVGASADSTTPIPDFAAPDWVFVSNTGATTITAPNSSIIGRYAYAIYDEGGLLDANVAGYPAGTGPTAATEAGRKGPEAFADLTALGISTTGVNNIVGFRNYASAQPGGDFASNFTFTAASATLYYNFVIGNTPGFLTVNPVPTPSPATLASRTDQAFVNRQELINFCRATSGGIFTADALQYLTTFSRELNAPTWKPSTPAGIAAGSTFDYALQANTPTASTSTAINRDLLYVRAAGTFTRPDGTSAAVGDLLIKRRFPLSRINGLIDPTFASTVNSTINSGSRVPATAATVQRDFGLWWDSANNRWNYVGASTTTPPTVQPRILRLDEVANGKVLDATGAYTGQTIYREPNFFELLKAGILSGSVGIGSGSANTFVASDPKYYITGTTPSNLLSADYQIMQIGANIIDQWDSDNVPTFINFGGNELAGIENLPYLNKLVFKPYWTSKAGATITYKFDAWLLPSLWNPHQNAPAPAAQNVRVTMTSGTMIATTTSPAITSSLASTQFMTFDASQFVTFPSPPTGIVGGSQSSASITKSPDNYYGFHYPTVSYPTGITPIPSNSSTAYPDFGAGCTFELQVQVNGNWKSYQKWSGCALQPATSLAYQQLALNPLNNTTLQDPEFVTLDPRTLRFGVWGNAGSQSNATTDYTSSAVTTLETSAAVFETIPAANTVLRPHGTMFASSTSTDLYKYANNNDGTVYYTDSDTLQRRGDRGIIAGTTTPMLPANSSDRPQILNRPFQSMAELGQVFRDQPWKTLDFGDFIAATAPGPDAGLLDIFTLHEASMEAGKTSLNTRQTPVLTAILSGATKRLADGTTAINSTQRNNIVTALVALQPMVRKTDFLTGPGLADNTTTGPVTGLGNKEARELVIRAFSDAGQTRTWNLMIDVVAQSGRYPPNASTLAGFLVEGEQHYWVHVAIDRFTGQVIDKQIEVVNE
jgi:hypothetical protein